MTPAAAPERSIKINSYLIPGITLLMVTLQVFFPFKGWAILATGFGGMWGLAYLWANSIKKGLRIRREIRYGWKQVGDHIQEKISLENLSRFPALWVKVFDHSEMPGYSINKITTIGSKWYSPWISRGICQRRGVYTLGPTSLESGDPFGLYTVKIDYQETVTMMVVPPVVSLPRIEIAPGGRTGEGKSTSSGLERTIVAGGVREYIPGDSLRWLHWPTTARMNKPFVRMFDYSPSSNWWILLDMDQEVQAGTGQLSTEEFGVILAASLVHEGLQKGKQVGLISYGKELIWHQPGEGDGHLWEILRSLAEVRPGGPKLPVMLDKIRSVLEGRTSLVIITPNVDPIWLNNLGYLQRKAIAPTVLLLNPSGFGGQGNPATIQGRLLYMGIKHYNITDKFQDLTQPHPEEGQIQSRSRILNFSPMWGKQPTSRRN
jgi:uncharacterized protein (DUF58 family)